ncbi:MAG: hypothetical protein RR772_06090, partial [Gordonibacter sp.]
RVSAKTSPGETWRPFHFQDGNSNWLTIAALDRVSKTPEFKVCAVQVEKVLSVTCRWPPRALFAF